MKALRVAMVGFGKIAYGYSLNAEYSQEHKYATHTQAILANSAFKLDTVISDDLNAVLNVKDELGINFACSSAKDVPKKHTVDIVVFACPPNVNKIDILDFFPNLKAVFLEKPISQSIEDSASLQKYLINRNIRSQVSYLRRGDQFILSLVNGGLKKLIGDTVNVQVTYGNGLKNNGSHLIDLARMLFGESKGILFTKNSPIETTLLEGDRNISFLIEMQNNIVVSGLPIDFNNYRENSMDIWGTNGRITFTQEGSYYQYWKIKKSRFGHGYMEIDWSTPEYGSTEIGESLYILYDNLQSNLKGQEELISSLDSALITENLINDMLEL